MGWGAQRGRTESAHGAPRGSLGWSLLSGCSQAPIRVEGTIYSATESIDTVLSAPLAKEFRGGDTPEERLVMVS